VPDEEIDLLRSVLARAYEEPRPFLLRVILAATDRVGSRISRKPVIETLDIAEKNNGYPLS
jgi:hypothetical protein